MRVAAIHYVREHNPRMRQPMIVERHEESRSDTPARPHRAGGLSHQPENRAAVDPTGFAYARRTTGVFSVLVTPSAGFGWLPAGPVLFAEGATLVTLSCPWRVGCFIF